MANQSALALLNKASEEVIGTPISQVLPLFNFSRWVDGSKSADS
ncbi:hypothetical protein ACT691_18750 [Vibrio metschnikovii]